MLKPYFYYLYKYYNFNKVRYFVSLLCLIICYLSIEIVFSFSSVIENDAQHIYSDYFQGANFILASPKGIKFDRTGNLKDTPYLRSSIVKYYLANLHSSNFDLSGNKFKLAKNISSTKYILIHNKSLPKVITDFNTKYKIKSLSSYTSVDSSYNGILYNTKGTNNRFSFFSFENQISSFVLGSELVSKTGLISVLMFLFSTVFTLYISVLYFQERQVEFLILTRQGYTDEGIKIISIDCLTQNLFSFVISFLFLTILMYVSTETKVEFFQSLKGIYYIIPYFPILTVLQFLLLLSKGINYESNFK